jgi:hypothetical protein
MSAACVFLLQQIIEVNNGLRHGLDKGLPISSLMENWDFLQVRHTFCYFSLAGLLTQLAAAFLELFLALGC